MLICPSHELQSGDNWWTFLSSEVVNANSHEPCTKKVSGMWNIQNLYMEVLGCWDHPWLWICSSCTAYFLLTSPTGESSSTAFSMCCHTKECCNMRPQITRLCMMLGISIFECASSIVAWVVLPTIHAGAQCTIWCWASWLYVIYHGRRYSGITPHPARHHVVKIIALWRSEDLIET